MAKRLNWERASQMRKVYQERHRDFNPEALEFGARFVKHKGKWHIKVTRMDVQSGQLIKVDKRSGQTAEVVLDNCISKASHGSVWTFQRLEDKL